ncbi:hypothetical protein HCZ23_00510 [Celeribacter sp. HF31]|uniref:hypothetical protein n=1 Tax=Celeribacter sp. HF31 TaxID=2721558 RepID=UPI001431AAE5|nr:hypothetical protein [Celeribacter sp. HF31]NIY77952.1 hypothetical protein [Celeribacter sp. HF31]
MTERAFDDLAKTLFAGENTVTDVKLMPGTKKDVSVEELSGALWQSMERMGLIKDGVLINKNAQ